MIDRALRGSKDRIVAPLVRGLAGRVAPGWLTALSFGFGVGGGILAGLGWRWLAAATWFAGRVFDGLDGPVARAGTAETDLGGYLDMMADTAGYSAVPLGIAAARADTATWATCAVLLATFYLNTMSWTYLAAIAEKRGEGAAAQEEKTTVHMPSGLIEGTETIVFFVAMLVWPAGAPGLFGLMAALVAVTIGQRLWWAAGHLR